MIPAAFLAFYQCVNMRCAIQTARGRHGADKILPQLLQIMRKTCAFDLGQNDDICANGSRPLGVHAITTCQTEAYVSGFPRQRSRP